ncbi:hypothetical protein AVEN_29301-1 [Araneus ventricosus]|uniref:Uncharacterized protein n=1 Tax=Araneus ventricosus TaxID=182803 RepID=A0A4Y2QP68_ARAVE|nr:hypothetical protein AVEN_71147-1 [Araneus ventricosus]GBN65103.1 hypothetical protein AVEN_29301-1 [Araneus ventricosus]
MTNSAIEKQIFSFNETETVDEILELLKVAGIEYDLKALECEDNLERFDDLSLIENAVAQGTNSESEEQSASDDVIQHVEPTMTAQQTLKQIYFIMANSKSMKDVYI